MKLSFPHPLTAVAGQKTYSPATDFRNFKTCNFIVQTADGEPNATMPKFSVWVGDNPDPEAATRLLQVCDAVDLTEAQPEVVCDPETGEKVQVPPSFTRIAMDVRLKDVGTILEHAGIGITCDGGCEDYHYIYLCVEGEGEFVICCLCFDPQYDFGCEEHYNEFTGAYENQSGVDGCQGCASKKIQNAKALAEAKKNQRIQDAKVLASSES